MGHTTHFLLLLLTTFVYVQNGFACSIQGVSGNLGLLSILDTSRGIMFQGTTTGIQAIVNAAHGGDGVSEGPYFSVSLQDDQFVLELHENFVHYEEYNTASTMSVDVTCSCTTQANNININFIIDITDTNNNAPTFLPSNELTFQVTPPLPPGYLVTGCLSGITVRDIDLTTYRIDFNIEDNEYFAIEYDETSSQEPKIFGATLRTTTFIRSIPEPITLWITATDVDLTGNDPITTRATIRIEGDEDFTFPEEPVFSQVFYLGTYTSENEVLLPLPIFLQQGYDDTVRFNISGEHSSYFDLMAVGSTLSILVTSPLPRDIILLGQLLLELSAEREFTSGATATLVLDLPEDLVLQFTEPLYEASIVDGTLSPVVLTLTQGYEYGYDVSIIHEHNTFFTWSASENVITISMLPLDSSIIEQNSFITLQVIATSDSSSGSTIVSLDIVKDDTVTPVFEESLYTGIYDPLIPNLRIGPLTLAQGYDATVTFDFESDYRQYGDLILDNNSVYVEVTSLPQQVLENEQHIFFTIIASKPRTVGATTTVAIAMPQARALSFAQSSYTGQLEGSSLTLETIVLSNGYTPDVLFRLVGDYATYFEATNNLNEVTVNLSIPLPEDAILNNNFITLTLEAIDTNAITGITNIVLDVIKQDIVTPVFSKNIYDGTFQGTNEVDVESIFLSQGYDSSVNFRLDGDHSQYFAWARDDNNNVVVSLQSSIPEELIFELKVLVFNIVAEKPLTVGANAAIYINFPSNLTEPAILSFGENVYVGSLENDLLSLETIVLETGFATNTYFALAGEFAPYFVETSIDNVVTIAQRIPLPADVIASKKFITLELQAQRERAVTTSTAIVIEIIVEEVIPVFSGPYYTGSYTSEGGLVIDHAIYLTQGYDSTVIFELEGDYSVFFDLQQDEYEVRLILKDEISLPEELVQNYRQLLFSIVATKPNIDGVRATVSIDLPDEASTVLLRFAQSSYVGRLDTTGLQVDPITLLAEHTDNLNFTITGEYSGYFTVTQNINTITLVANDDLPLETILNDEVFIILDIVASRPDSISATTAVVFEVIRTIVVEPVFDRTFYAGSYSNGDLLMEGTIQLVQGYDETVLFSLDENEADSQYFSINQDENRVELTVQSSISEALNKTHLITSVIASKPGTSASAAIVISLDASGNTITFSQVYYTGTIEDGAAVTLEEIRIEKGYTQDMDIVLLGENQNLFRLEHNIGQGDTGVVQIYLDSDLPAEVTGRILTFTLEARSGTEIAYATIVFELVRSSDETGALIFEEAHYLGSYSETGLSFDHQIRLISDSGTDVTFWLEGEYNQYFDLVEDDNNGYMTISLNQTLPEELLQNNRQLALTMVARAVGYLEGRTAIVIALGNDTIPQTVLRFSQTYYSGQLESTSVNLNKIVISEGYDPETTLNFDLRGDLAEYFEIRKDDESTAAYYLAILLPLPDDLMENRILTLLEVEASAPQAISALATIVLEYDLTYNHSSIIFAEAFYTGSYSDLGFVFENTISLESGYSDNILFTIEEEYQQWFTLEQNGNAISLILTNPIPLENLLNNHNLIFTVSATGTNAATAITTIIIALESDLPAATVLRFQYNNYRGSIDSDILELESITLSQGYTEEVTFHLIGDTEEYFYLIEDGPIVTIVMRNSTPENIPSEEKTIILELEAASPESISAYTTIVLEIKSEENIGEALVFSEAYYTGRYTENSELIFEDSISLTQGYDETVTFEIEGDHTQWFQLSSNGNIVSIILVNSIPAEILAANQQLLFVIIANKPGSIFARSAIVITLPQLGDDLVFLRFERTSYLGEIHLPGTTDIVSMSDQIILSQGYSPEVSFSWTEDGGELREYFYIHNEGPVVTILQLEALPEILIPANYLIVLGLQASAPQAISTFTTILIKIIKDDELDSAAPLIFSQAYYTGYYSQEENLVFENIISLSEGYDESVYFELEGEHIELFILEEQSQNSLMLKLQNPISSTILANNNKLIFEVKAERPNNIIARAPIIISLIYDVSSVTVLRFDAVNYRGILENGVINLSPIILSTGYSQNVQFNLRGELASYFGADNIGPTVTIVQISSLPEEVISNKELIVFDIIASATGSISALAAIILEQPNVEESPIQAPIFSESFYVGHYHVDEGLVLEGVITLAEGYDDSVEFDIQGDDAQWFTVQSNGNFVELIPSNNLSVLELARNYLTFSVIAVKPGTTIAQAGIFISIQDDSTSSPAIAFGKALYTGVFQLDVVRHEVITVSGYTGSEIGISGAYSDQFEASVTDETVSVLARSSVVLPEDISHLALELQAGTARTALVLDVSLSEVAALPTVTFSAPSYKIRLDVSQTGLVGRVQATADNGERLTYAVQTENVHLLERLSVSDDGELHLFAPANSGLYEFSVTATTIASRVSASALVRLSVDAITVCGDDLVVPPLIILDRDEEEPHNNLVVLDSSHADCRYSLTNRWPLEQDWLFVDETGLHARAIDREDSSIAFMALSQVQVELILHCDNDSLIRSKRSLSPRLDWLGPYDYGNNKWTLTDTILYNSRRSLVNLIVNDINDNDPIFVGKENEPIAVGYPVPELLDVIMPRALAELKATDADIGENAALMYWSSAPQLAVAPSSGTIHVRDNQRELEEGTRFTVHATDRNGEGNTGDIDLMVRLLDVEHIAVLTIRDAFQDDEAVIISDLTSAIGYDVKVLTSTVISDEYEVTDNTEGFRSKRQAVESGGASLRLYVYGMVQRDPVDVNQLTSDISSNVIPSVVVDSISLQDYLDSHEVCVGAGSARDTGLLVATIVLSIFLFILILFIALWFFLKWWKSRNYDQFSDTNSLTSRNDSVNLAPKLDTLTRPRLNIEELKRSERRLQEMLEAPVNEVTVETASKNPLDTKIDVPLPDINVPIVIQSIDKLKDAVDSDDDEYGEVKKLARRKSVVTFNENVEKIIHVEDPAEDNSSDIEIERL